MFGMSFVVNNSLSTYFVAARYSALAGEDFAAVYLEAAAPLPKPRETRWETRYQKTKNELEPAVSSRAVLFRGYKAQKQYSRYLSILYTTLGVLTAVSCCGAERSAVTGQWLGEYQQTEGASYVAFPSAHWGGHCLLYTSPSPRDGLLSRMPSSA